MKQERLTVEEMGLKYPDQWLFITDCVKIKYIHVLTNLQTHFKVGW